MLYQGPMLAQVSFPVTDKGAIVIDRLTIKDDLEAFLTMGFKFPIIVAALDVNIDIDEIGIGDQVAIDHIPFRFVRCAKVSTGRYWLMTEVDWENYVSKHQFTKWVEYGGKEGKDGSDEVVRSGETG